MPDARQLQAVVSAPFRTPGQPGPEPVRTPGQILVPRHVWVTICPVCGPVGAAKDKATARETSCGMAPDPAHMLMRVEGYVPEKAELRR